MVVYLCVCLYVEQPCTPLDESIVCSARISWLHGQKRQFLKGMSLLPVIV